MTLLAGVRRVQTPEGAKRFGVPLHGIIGRRGDDAAKKAGKPDVPSGPPRKFVGTVPGQKAKIPAMSAASRPTVSGLSHSDRTALGRVSMMEELVGTLTRAQANAMRDARTGQISDSQRKMLIRLIRRALSKAGYGQTPAPQTPAQKRAAAAAAKKSAKAAKAAPTKKTSATPQPSKKPSQAAWLDQLSSALRALTGKSGGRQRTQPRRSPAGGRVNTKKIPSSFTGMTDEQLRKSVRSLVAMKRAAMHDPAGLARVNDALVKARAERDRRGMP